MGAVPWLFWHRRDLRLADNLGLAQLAAHTTAITGLVVLETGCHPILLPDSQSSLPRGMELAPWA